MTPIAFSLLLAVALSSALAGYVLRRRDTTAVLQFALLAVCVAIWCAAAAAEIMVTAVETKLLFARISYFGIAPMPVLFLAFSFESAGRRGASQRFIGPLFLVPVATLVIVWSNSMHGLMCAEEMAHQRDLGE